MIYVKIEIWPGGNWQRPRTLQEAIIWNKGGTRSVGEYGYAFSKVGGFKTAFQELCRGTFKNALRTGEIKGFPRLRLYAHDLLFRALFKSFGARNLSSPEEFDTAVSLGAAEIDASKEAARENGSTFT